MINSSTPDWVGNSMGRNGTSTGHQPLLLTITAQKQIRQHEARMWRPGCGGHIYKVSEAAWQRRYPPLALLYQADHVTIGGETAGLGGRRPDRQWWGWVGFEGVLWQTPVAVCRQVTPHPPLPINHSTVRTLILSERQLLYR